MEKRDSEIEGPEAASGDGRDGRRGKAGVAGGLRSLKGWQAVPVAVIAIYVFLGIFGPTVAPFEPNRGTVADRLCPPLGMNALTIAEHPASRSTDCSSANILGTDQNGRDIFSRLLHGARTSLSVVGPSVVVGTTLGVTVGVWLNGLRQRRRLIAYLIVGATIVPFGIFVVNQPEAFAFFVWIVRLENLDDAVRWSSIMSFSCVTALITLALIAVAYKFDDRCLPHWSRGVDTSHGISDFCSRFHQQVIALVPWIVLVVIASVVLILRHSQSLVFQTSAVRWSFERDYLFEHVGMFSPLVPIILLPIAFVTLGTWWFKRHLVCRLTTTSDSRPAAIGDFDDSPPEPLLDVAVPSEDGSDQMEPKEPEFEHGRSFADSVAIVKLRRWVPALIAIVAVLMIARFAVYEAWPNVRYLLHDSGISRESPTAKSVQERIEVLGCASEVRSKLSISLRELAPEERDLDPGQRCLDLYYQRRNAPTHHATFDFALKMVSQTLTMALIGAAVATALVIVSLRKTTPVRRVIQFLVGLAALTGLTITFGRTDWVIGVVQWIEPTVVIWSDRSFAIHGLLVIFRDFSVALGIGFVIATTLIAILHRARTVSMFNGVSGWGSMLFPCVCLTAGLMVVFHYPFPSFQLIVDDQLAIIADPSEDRFYGSSFPFLGAIPFRNWLWTYWFALIGYAAIVFGFFYAGISGFRRFADENRHSDTG